MPEPTVPDRDWGVQKEGRLPREPAPKSFTQRAPPSLGNNSFARARLDTGATIVALVRVDDVDVVAFGDGLIWALVDARTAGQAFIRDLMSH